MTAGNHDPWSIPLGWTLHYQPTTDSTNDDAKEAALAGCPDRTIFITDEQRAGRGRLGRHWLAPPGTSLLFSIVFRRPLPPILLTALCSVAAAEAVEQATALQARIKWPNDIMIGARKVCGVLTEVGPQHGSAVTVVGMGLNVNLDPATAGLPDTATSLSSELGRPVPREKLLRAILERIDATLVMSDALEAALRGRWEARLWRRRQLIRVDQAGTVVEGTVEGLAASGALRLATPDGRTREITVGDVLLE